MLRDAFNIALASLLLAVGICCAQELEVRHGDVLLRRQPHRLATSIRSLEAGEVLELRALEAHNGYFRVRIPGTAEEGWIHRSHVWHRLPDEQMLAEDEDRFLERHLGLGRPETSFQRPREGYVVAVDSRLRIPLWVQYELTAAELEGPGDRDLSSFREDRTVPRVGRAQLGDFRGNGFDRGHMAPAADMKRSQAIMDESFLLSNIAPQVGPAFNRGIWRRLEEAVRHWVRARGSLTIIVGPIFSVDEDGTVTYEVIGENEVAVPNAFFKIVADVGEADAVEALAFIIPNKAIFDRTIDEYLVSIDEVEAATGVDFLAELADDTQVALGRAARQRLGPSRDHS